MKESPPTPTPDVEFLGADALALDELVLALNRCFEGYRVAIRVDAKALLNMIRVDSVDLATGVVARIEGRVAGVALVARRGWTCRLAAMAIDPEFRGRKAGTRLTAHLLRAARDRNDREFVLETIEDNAPALRLYQSAGFVTVRRLVGYSADIVEGREDAALQEMDPVAVGLSVGQWGLKQLPWQLAPQTLLALAPPHKAFRLGPALALITDPTGVAITIRGLVVDPALRRQGWGTRLLEALAARYPGRRWRVPCWVPEEIPKSFFMGLGFQKEALTQLQMARPL